MATVIVILILFLIGSLLIFLGSIDEIKQPKKKLKKEIEDKIKNAEKDKK